MLHLLSRTHRHTVAPKSGTVVCKSDSDTDCKAENQLQEPVCLQTYRTNLQVAIARALEGHGKEATSYSCSDALALMWIKVQLVSIALLLKQPRNWCTGGHGDWGVGQVQVRCLVGADQGDSTFHINPML